jgi:hypothetical protein
MAKFKNISDQRLTVGNVFGALSVEPGAEFLTAKKFALELLADGLVQEIKPSDRKVKKSSATKEANE